MNTPSYLTVELLNRAKTVVRESVLYKRFIDGTPLENDIAVWMADFAGQVRHEHTEHVKDFLNELYATMIDPCAEGSRTVTEMKQALLEAARRDRELLASRSLETETTLENLKHIILDFEEGTVGGNQREVATIHKTLNVVLAEINRQLLASRASAPTETEKTK